MIATNTNIRSLPIGRQIYGLLHQEISFFNEGVFFGFFLMMFYLLDRNVFVTGK